MYYFDIKKLFVEILLSLFLIKKYKILIFNNNYVKNQFKKKTDLTWCRGVEPKLPAN